MYENRSYLIFPVEELSKVDLSLVGETSADTLRKSVDGTKPFIKWDADMPEVAVHLDDPEGPYPHAQTLKIQTPEE